jgi:hypothetical protein
MANPLDGGGVSGRLSSLTDELAAVVVVLEMRDMDLPTKRDMALPVDLPREACCAVISGDGIPGREGRALFVPIETTLAAASAFRRIVHSSIPLGFSAGDKASSALLLGEFPSTTTQLFGLDSYPLCSSVPTGVFEPRFSPIKAVTRACGTASDLPSIITLCLLAAEEGNTLAPVPGESLGERLGEPLGVPGPMIAEGGG